MPILFNYFQNACAKQAFLLGYYTDAIKRLKKR